MNTQKKIIGVVVVVILMGGSFWGGMTYAKTNVPTRGTFTAGQFSGAVGAAGARGGFTRPGGMGGSATAGEIVTVEASNMTVKLANGSTQIVLLGTSIQIAKSVSGTVRDLTPGTSVTVVGQNNSDGSITAQSVQIRPAMPTKQQ